jgi:hypothetical protein
LFCFVFFFSHFFRVAFFKCESHLSLVFFLCVFFFSLENHRFLTAKKNTQAAVSATQSSSLSWKSSMPSTASPLGEGAGVEGVGAGVVPEAEGGASLRTKWHSWQHTLFEKCLLMGA